MKLCCVLILAAILLENEAKVSGAVPGAADLARLIHLVLHQKDEQDLQRAEPRQPFSEDYFMVRSEKPEVDDTLDKRYVDQQAPNVRLLIIKNPRVLEEFKKRNYKSYHTSNENSNYVYELDQRRRAVFRLDSSSIERTLRTKADENMMVMNRGDSSERRAHDKRNQDRDRNSVDVYVDNDALRRKKGREEDLTQDAWDVITKKYEWDKPKRERSKKENKMADDWDKVTKQNFDDWDKKTTRKRREDRMNKPKKIDWDSGEIKSKKQKYFDKSYESKSKKKAAKDWDVDDVVKITTKQWKSEPKTNWNKEHVPMASYYDNPRPKKRDHYEGTGIFGRTPIPFVGRHGIYVD